MSDKSKKKPPSEVEAEGQNIWPQIRQLLIFQVKLYVDALRDLLMSPVSIVVVIIDLVQDKKGDEALFESLLRFGRKTEKFINLFNQHDVKAEDIEDIESIIDKVEDSVLKKNSEDSAANDPKENLEK